MLPHNSVKRVPSSRDDGMILTPEICSLSGLLLAVGASARCRELLLYSRASSVLASFFCSRELCATFGLSRLAAFV